MSCDGVRRLCMVGRKHNHEDMHEPEHTDLVTTNNTSRSNEPTEPISMAGREASADSFVTTLIVPRSPSSVEANNSVEHDGRDAVTIATPRQSTRTVTNLAMSTPSSRSLHAAERVPITTNLTDRENMTVSTSPLAFAKKPCSGMPYSDANYTSVAVPSASILCGDNVLDVPTCRARDDANEASGNTELRRDEEPNGSGPHKRPVQSVSLGLQLWATLRRHMLLQRRGLCSYICELLIPIIFVIGSIILWAIFGTKSYDDHEYFSPTNALHTFELYAITPSMMCYNESTGAALAAIGSLQPCANLALFINASNPLLCSDGSSEVPEGFCGMLLAGLATYSGWKLLVQGNTSLVPDFDTLVPFKWMNRLANDNLNGIFDIGGHTAEAAMLTGGKLLFTPDTPDTAKLVSYLSKTFAYFPFVYGGTMSMAEAEARVRARTIDVPTIWGILNLKNMTRDAFDVEIRLNSTSLPESTRAVMLTYVGGIANDTGELYLFSGFMTLQKAVYDYYLTNIQEVEVPYKQLAMIPTPTKAFKRQLFLFYGAQLTPLIIVLGFLYPVSQMTKHIVIEKELRIREAMLIMGVSEGIMYTAWMIIYVVQYIVTSAVIALLLKVTYVKHSNFGILFFLLFFFSLTIITMSGAIAACFSKARLATLLAPLIYFVLSIPLFALQDSTASVRRGILVLSPSALSVAFGVLFNHELEGGMKGSDMRYFRDDPDMLTIITVLFGDFLLYGLLTVYLDAVIPKDWGVSKSPIFFITDPIRYFCGRRKPLEGGPDGRDPNGVFEDMDDEDMAVRIEGLRKEYKRNGHHFAAVDNLYWSLREKEISVLLGHNGAGKTTVMNMMTGMTAPDEGDCYVYGYSVRTQLQKVRQLIGFCPQHNILWPELTCREHLEFFGRIKGLKGAELDEAVRMILEEVDLAEKAKQPSRALSGGQKRKLSIAIAFVGRSPLVFLDEPTAGLDVGARRQIWELLKRMAQSHTILLTTHYMDEADLLGHRIGIMSQGRLKCNGSSVFLKSRLGVGYSITMSLTNKADVSTVTDMVTQMVNGATQLGHHGSEAMYRLPRESEDQFPAFLEMVEKAKDEYGIRGYSISATTLEEVFLRIAADDVVSEQAQDPLLNTTQSVIERQEHMIWNSVMITNGIALIRSQFRAMMYKRLLSGLRDRRMQCFVIICPVASVCIAMLLTLITATSPSLLPLSGALYYNNGMMELSGCDELLGSPATLFDFNVSEVPWPNALNLSWYDVDTVEAHPFYRVASLFCHDPEVTRVTGMSNNVMHLLNSTAFHQAPISLNTFYNSLLNYVAGTPQRMSITASTFPDTAKAAADLIKQLLMGAILMIPFTFMPSVPVGWVVKERECKARHLQDISGLRFHIYWMSNFVFDIGCYIITMLFVILVLAVFNRQEFIGGARIGPTMVSFIIYGLTSTVTAYALSFLFKNHSIAQTMVLAISFVSGFILVMMVFLLSFMDSTVDASDKMRWAFRIIPSYCIGECIINLSMLSERQRAGSTLTPWSMDVVGWACVYMSAEFPLFVMVTFVCDYAKRSFRGRASAYDREAPSEIIEDEDSDVEDERLAVYEQEAAEENEDIVRVVDLRKVYKNGTIAVRNLTFATRSGEIFGFLGTNGAGKTTTISILCQEFLPTSGHASVCGYDIVEEGSEALQCIGYCPQFDATLDLLTVEEHLYMYAGVRGITYQDRDDVVAGLLRMCELSKYRQSCSSELSGGNRRKLSMAIALIGGPQVVFLDEPSAGMDPVARRGMWTAIERMAQRSCVVLTTHHLEEVEALAHRVAIMVSGSLRCIGDKTHLKTKFGTGLEMHIRVANEAYAEPVIDWALNSFPGTVVSEARDQSLVFSLPYMASLAYVFRGLQTHCNSLHILDYSVSQTSIEQVFLKVSGTRATDVL